MKMTAHICVRVAVLAVGGALALCAQTPHPLPKAKGIAAKDLQRPMTGIHPTATFATGGEPDWLALSSDAVWVASSKTNQVFRLDATTNKIAGFATVAKPCSGLLIAFGSLWVPSCGDHAVVRVDPATQKIVATIPASPANSEGGIAAGAGSVWVVTAPKGELVRIDPATNRIRATISIPSASFAPAFADGSVWITSTGNNLLTRVDPATNKVVSTTPVGKQPRFVTVGAGSVWTLNQEDGTVSRVDTSNGKLVATIQAGLSGFGGEIAFGEGAIWATMPEFPMTRIDAATNKITRQYTGKGGDSIRAGLGSIWLTDYSGGVVWRLDPASL